MLDASHSEAARQVESKAIELSNVLDLAKIEAGKLALSKQLAELIGGKLWVESIPD